MVESVSFNITWAEVWRSVRDFVFIAIAIFFSTFLKELNVEDFFLNNPETLLLGVKVAINASWKYIITLGLLPFFNRFIRTK